MVAIIQVQQLVKRFGEHTAVNSVNFDVEEGEVFGLLGPNGAGKSTTIQNGRYASCAMIRPT